MNSTGSRSKPGHDRDGSKSSGDDRSGERGSDWGGRDERLVPELPGWRVN